MSTSLLHFLFFFFSYFTRTACAVHTNFLNADALYVQIVQSRDKILQKSGLYEAPPSGKLKNIMVF